MSFKAKLSIVAAIVLLIFGAVGTGIYYAYYFVSYTQGMALYRQARREIDAERYDAALVHLDAAASKKLDATTKSYVYGNRGWVQSKKRRDDQAIRDFSESIRLTAQPYYAFLDRGLVYHRRGEFEKALSDYDAALARDRNIPDAYHRRGRIHEDRGDWAKAIADYSEAIRCAPGYPQYYVDRGIAFLGNNELDSAIASFDSAIMFNPTHAGAYIYRAVAYARKGNLPKGLADVTEAIRQRPEAEQLRYARAMIYIDRGFIDEAIEDCNESLRIAPDYDLGFLTRARAEAIEKDWENVLRDATTALELNPALYFAYYLRGRAHTAKGDFDRAIAEFDEALRREPAFPWALIWRALAYSYRGDCSRAQQELKQTLERFPGAEAPHLGLAWFMATCQNAAYRNGADAVAEGLKACEISYWNNWYAADVLAAAYAEEGDFDRAIQFAKLALSLPGSSRTERVSMEERLSRYEMRLPARDSGISAGKRTRIEEGVSAYTRQDYDGAIRHFDAVLPPNPGASISATLFHFFDGTYARPGTNRAPWAPSEVLQLANAFYYRGLAYQRKREYDNAIADFTAALHWEPKSSPVLRERGVTYSMKGETARGLRDFDKVIRLYPDEALGYALRADTLQATNQWDAALEAVATALRINPTLATAYHIRAQAYLGKKQYDNAICDFGEADRLDPNHTSSILARAGAFGAKGDYRSALADFRNAFERFPRSAEARNSLAWFLATCPEAAYRNGAEAVVLAKAACDLTRWREPSVLDTLAAAYAEAGDFERAIKLQTQAIALLGPKDSNREAMEERGRSFSERKLTARSRWNRVFRLIPS